MIQILLLALFFAALTVGLYFAMNVIYLKYRWNALNPVLTTTTLLVLFLLLFNFTYDTYMYGGRIVMFPLGPAVVALAIPLYKQRELLKRHFLAVMLGILVGASVGMVSGVLLAVLLDFPIEIVSALLPKSVTSPVAMQISESLGGSAPLAAVFVMLAGFSAALAGPLMMKWLRIDSPIGKGIAFGTAAHGIGTSKAFEDGPEAGSMASVAMTLSAVAGAFLAPVVALWFGL